MNRLPTLLTAAACGLLLGGKAALALTPLPLVPGADLLVRVQLGNGGPVGGGPNGHDNGAHSYGSAPSVLNPSGANGGAQPGGTGPINGTGAAPAAAGARPNGARGGNGSKPAPMQANGVRKID